MAETHKTVKQGLGERQGSVQRHRPTQVELLQRRIERVGFDRLSARERVMWAAQQRLGNLEGIILDNVSDDEEADR